MWVKFNGFGWMQLHHYYAMPKRESRGQTIDKKGATLGSTLLRQL
jgi:hypothetical protein